MISDLFVANRIRRPSPATGREPDSGKPSATGTPPRIRTFPSIRFFIESGLIEPKRASSARAWRLWRYIPVPEQEARRRSRASRPNRRGRSSSSPSSWRSFRGRNSSRFAQACCRNGGPGLYRRLPARWMFRHRIDYLDLPGRLFSSGHALRSVDRRVSPHRRRRERARHPRRSRSAEKTASAGFPSSFIGFSFPCRLFLRFAFRPASLLLSRVARSKPQARRFPRPSVVRQSSASRDSDVASPCRSATRPRILRSTAAQ